MAGRAAESALPAQQHHASASASALHLVKPTPPPQKPLQPVPPKPAKPLVAASHASRTPSIQSHLLDSKANLADPVPVSTPHKPLVPIRNAAVESAVAVPVRPSAPSGDGPPSPSDILRSSPPAQLTPQTEMHSVTLEAKAKVKTDSSDPLKSEAAGTNIPQPEPVTTDQDSEAILPDRASNQHALHAPRPSHCESRLPEPDPEMGTSPFGQQLSGQRSGEAVTDSSVEGVASDTLDKKREKRTLPDTSTPDVADGSELKRRRTLVEVDDIEDPEGKEQSPREEKSSSSAQTEGGSERAIFASTGLSSGDSEEVSTATLATRAISASSSGGLLPVRAITSPSGGGVLPMLRSSPVFVESDGAAKEIVPACSTVDPIVDKRTTSTSDAAPSISERAEVQKNAMDISEANETLQLEPKKGKSVSWAPEENLVEVQYIDTRLELVRSWDPESQITLPFAPTTLLMFKSMSDEQLRAENGLGEQAGTGLNAEQKLGHKKISSFEAARKKEHDMELERARKAKEEQQQLLDKMSPARDWVRPSAIVLPTECRMDPDAIENFRIVDDGYRTVASRRGSHAESPPSPPPELRSAVDLRRMNDASVPLFPLSDGCNEATDSSPSSGASRGIGNCTQSGPQGFSDGSEISRRSGSGSAVPRSQMLGDDPGNLDGHGSSFAMSQHAVGVDGENDAGVRFNGVHGVFPDKTGPVPPHAVQHLLSALQSSGLLNHTSNHLRNDSDDYSNGNRRAEVDGRGDMYMERQPPSNRNADDRSNEPGPNGVYLEEDRRRGPGHEDGAMGVGSGMSPPNGNMGPPPPPPMLGHPGQLPPGFPPGVQQGGMMEGFPFPMPPIPPPGMGMPPNMLPLAMGIPMPPMGIPLPFGLPPGPLPVNGSNQGMGGSKSGKSGSGSGRAVETISRPKSKGSKQRKRCKYFGTKQGCRDGSSCVFAHN